VTGILDLEVRYPGGRVDVRELHAASGLPEEDLLAVMRNPGFAALGAGETAWETARDAAAALLERTGVRPEQIGQVLWAGSEQYDHPFWSPAAKVAAELGIGRAHCFEVANFCNGGAVALRVAADRLDAVGAGHTLVLVADRLTRLVDYTDPEAVDLFNFGDAAAAVLLTAGPGAYTLRHSAFRTDPSWADYYRGEQRDGRVVIRREPHRRGLAAAYVENFTALVGETLKALDAEIDDVACLLVNHGDHEMHERLLGELGLDPHRTVRNYDRLGHMGGADTLIALDRLRTERRLRRGDLVLLATSAMGFSWGITALECQ
jgi:3-oxoacyl-[acyl-carrier-protein] synthase-3